MTDFTLNLGECFGEGTFTLRYCFKSANMTSRAGGFDGKSSSSAGAFVVKNTKSNCQVFGNDGGIADIDLKDGRVELKFGNQGFNQKYHRDFYPHKTFKARFQNAHIEFCSIGEIDGDDSSSSVSEFIEVGEFNQVFGLFSEPNVTACPVLKSPYGMLHGEKENVFIDLEEFMPVTKLDGRTPFVLDENMDCTMGMCVYDPTNSL